MPQGPKPFSKAVGIPCVEVRPGMVLAAQAKSAMVCAPVDL